MLLITLIKGTTPERKHSGSAPAQFPLLVLGAILVLPQTWTCRLQTNLCRLLCSSELKNTKTLTHLKLFNDYRYRNFAGKRVISVGTEYYRKSRYTVTLTFSSLNFSFFVTFRAQLFHIIMRFTESLCNKKLNWMLWVSF